MIAEAPQGVRARRPKLWEMEHKCHCPLIGVCFELAEMRKLLGKVMRVPAGCSDFDIHSTAVRECASHTRLAGMLHKELERRYGLYVQQYKALKDADELYQRWRQAVHEGSIAGPLWAVLSHPACSEALTHVIYSDVHMLQHQVGAGQRAEQRLLVELRRENVALGRELARMQQRFSDYRDARVAELEGLKKRLVEARAEAVRQEARAEQAAARVPPLGAMAQAQQECARLRQRLARAEADGADLRQQLEHVLQLLHSAQADSRRLEQELLGAAGAAAAAPASSMREVKLEGCTVLCVGGMGSAARYRALVEKRGGAFLHHDGGSEESLRRLEGVIGAADAVICQTGCISHNAYWRVKDQCKRTGKPCAFVENPSLSRFLQVLDSLAEERAGQTGAAG